MGSPFGSLISGMFGLGSTVLTNNTEAALTRQTNETNYQIAQEANQLQRDENEKTRSFNSEEADKAYQRELDKMRLQHQFNSPLELVRQYREAGLNPAFSTGNASGQVGSQSAPSATSSASFNPALPNMIKPVMQPFPNIVDGVLNSALKLADIKQKSAEAGKTNTEAEFLSRSLENRLRQLNAEADISEFTSLMNENFGFAKNYAELAALEKSAVKLAAEGDLAQAAAAHERVKQELTKAMHEEKGLDISLKRKELDNYDTLFRARLQVLSSEANRNNAGAEQSRATSEQIRELTPAQKTLMEKDAEYRTSQIKTDEKLRKKIAKEVLDITEKTRAQKFTNDQRDRLIKELDSQIRTGALQQQQDLFNPFKYVGGLLSGSAGAAVKLVQ